MAGEVPFESAKLRIRGRIDLIAQEGSGLVILSDHKSGTVVDSNGHVDEHTSLQLRLYGLAVLDCAPRSHVVLRVMSRDGELFVPFDTNEIQTTSEWLISIIERLPAGTTVAAEDLAVVGPQCRRCPVRPVCASYREAVKELWKMSDMVLPLDISGSILQVDTQDEYLAIKMLDLSGRVIKVHRLLPRNGLDSVGQSLWCFNLASAESRRGTSPRHPRNFHEVGMTSGDQTAWSLTIFRNED